MMIRDLVALLLAGCAVLIGTWSRWSDLCGGVLMLALILAALVLAIC